MVAKMLCLKMCVHGNYKTSFKDLLPRKHYIFCNSWQQENTSFPSIISITKLTAYVLGFGVSAAEDSSSELTPRCNQVAKLSSIRPIR